MFMLLINVFFIPCDNQKIFFFIKVYRCYPEILFNRYVLFNHELTGQNVSEKIGIRTLKALKKPSQNKNNEPHQNFTGSY